MIAQIISLPAIASALATCLLANSHPLGTTFKPRDAQNQAVFASSSSSSGIKVERYDDEQIWRLDWSAFNETTKRDIQKVIEIMDVDVWHASPAQIDLRLSSSQTSHLLPFIPYPDTFTPIIPNLQSLIDASQPMQLKEPGEISTWDLSTIDSPFHQTYHNLDELYAFGDAISDYFNGLRGVRIETSDIGQTFQDRKIRGWKLWMESEGNETRVEREFVVQSGQHAREWVGPSVALYFLHSLLLSATSGDPEALLALKTFTFTIVPTVNPDGYVYSHEHSRLWRKNRQFLGREDCVGIDLNANWGYKWRAPHTNDPCTETYAGKSAFEAYETRAMADYLFNANGPSPIYGGRRPPIYGGRRPSKSNARDDSMRRIRAFVDLHSYGQLFMFPFAYSCDEFPVDGEMLMEASLGVAKAMRDTDGESYMTGQACGLTYRAPGDAIDFAYGATDVRWSFSAELRDTGLHGFLLPPSYIRPTGQEVTAGLISLAKFIYTTEIAG